MKTDKWKIGDKLYNSAFKWRTIFSEEDDKELCISAGCINISVQGRKAAKATKNKVTRGLDGRFKSIKIDGWRATYGTTIPEKISPDDMRRISLFMSDVSTRIVYLEERIEALEKKLKHGQPEYINLGGAGGCNGTC